MTYATLDPSAKNAAITLSNGNLTATTDTTASSELVKATQFKSSGKWYYEVMLTAIATAMEVGIADSSAATNAGVADTTHGYAYCPQDGKKYNNNISSAYGATSANGVVISVLHDADGGTLTFWKNGSTLGTAYTGITGSWAPAVSWFPSGTAGAVTVNFGAAAFAYTPTVGFSGYLVADPGSKGSGAVTMQVMTAFGQRIATGAASMQRMTATGGYHGHGVAVMLPMTASGGGGPHYGAGAMQPMTATAIGRQANRGTPAMLPMTAAGTGHDIAIWAIAVHAPPPALVAVTLTGEAITFAGVAPVPICLIGTKDIVLVAPAPLLVATMLPGLVATVSARAPALVLVATCSNPTIITVAGSARAPILQAALAAGQIATAVLATRAPQVSITVLSGNVATIIARAVAPIMAAVGFPAYTITFAGVARAPRLVSELSAPVGSNYNTWVLNTRKGVLTEYDNFLFNSFCTYQGQVLAVGDSGLVVLGTQVNDGGTAISGKFRTGRNSFGSSYHKRVPRIYTGIQADGDCYLKTITPEGGERTYRIAWNHATDLRQARIGVGKGPRSRYWQFEVGNTEGSDFGVDNLLVMPVTLRRRVM